MEALVLAAGEGSRLGKLTQRKPKALLHVAGMPLLGRILHGLKEAGVQDVWIVVGYKANMIREEISENYAGLNIRFLENKHWEKGNLHSLLTAQEIFQQSRFLLCMCDHIFDPDIPKSLINNGSEKALVLAIDKVSEEDTKILEQNGTIVDIGKKINQSNVAIDTGFFLCSPKIFDYAEEVAQEGLSELTDCVRVAANRGDTEVVDVSGHWWADIDTKQDLDRAKRSIVEDSQKRGTSDFVAHYFNRPVENTILYHISDWLFITPNRLTIVTNVLAWFITYLFFSGHLVLGSILTFVVGIMDGLDGKLARIRRRQTRLGLMEHPLDLLYEFSWLIALALFLSRTQGLLPLELCMLSLMLIAFYRFCYDQFSRTMNVSLDMYGRFEQTFRRVAGRRNIYNVYIFFGVIFGVPLYSLFAILFHSALTAVVYAYRASIHMQAADRLSIPTLKEKVHRT